MFYVCHHFFGAGGGDFGAFSRSVFDAEAFLFVPVVFANVSVASWASVEVAFGFVLGYFKGGFVFFVPFGGHALKSVAHHVGALFNAVSAAAAG